MHEFPVPRGRTSQEKLSREPNRYVTLIDCSLGDARQYRFPKSTNGSGFANTPAPRANSHDPNERATKMGLDLRMTPLRRLPRPVLYNVIASGTQVL